MVITYLSADDSGSARALEKYVTEQALLKKCERIQVHSSDWLTPAHQFYVEQGYREHPKYFTKRLVYAK